MHCPKCGAPAAEAQKFCRTCGFGLEKVEQLLDESPQAIPANQIPAENSDKLQKRLTRMDKVWHAAAVIFLGSFVATVCWGIIDKIIIEKGAVVSGSLFLLFILGIVFLGLFGTYVESQRKKLASSQSRLSSSQPPELQSLNSKLNADTTNKLLPEPDLSVPTSVTEETTARLAEKINAAR